jgi:hypothetical protein
MASSSWLLLMASHGSGNPMKDEKVSSTSDKFNTTNESRQEGSFNPSSAKMPRFMSFLVPLIWAGFLLFGVLRFTPPGWFMEVKSIRVGPGLIQIVMMIAIINYLFRAYMKKKNYTFRHIEGLNVLGRILFHCLIAYAVCVYLPSLGGKL